MELKPKKNKYITVYLIRVTIKHGEKLKIVDSVHFLFTKIFSTFACFLQYCVTELLLYDLNINFRVVTHLVVFTLDSFSGKRSIC